MLSRVDAVTVALSKALASVGGAIMTSRAAADGIRASAMPYVFSAGNDPASVAAALAALRILRSEPERVSRLQDNCAARRVLPGGAHPDRRGGRGHRRPDRAGRGHADRLAAGLRRRAST